MLLQFDYEKYGAVASFRELHEATREMLLEADGVKTTVLGPVTSDDPETMEYNLDALRYKARRLSSKWTVLDLTSFQKIIVDLIKRSGVKGYPYVILEEFTIPLIKSGVFKTLFVRENYKDSVGTSLEHDIALSCDIRIVYFE